MLKFNLDIQFVDINLVEANDYNPNFVCHVNMDLLRVSIEENGFCYPIVAVYDDEKKKYVIVDGYHRYKILRDEYKSDVVPIVLLKNEMNKRMSATIQFNRARGVHKIDGDANIVVTLSKNGMEDKDICKYLGMDEDEVLRLKQSTGLKSAFADYEFSKSWDELKEKLERKKKEIV